jgi:UDP-glucose 4-epimerase
VGKRAWRKINFSGKRYMLAAAHFSVFSQVGESIKNPCKYYENNVGGTLMLLKAMKDNVYDNIFAKCYLGWEIMFNNVKEHIERALKWQKHELSKK